MKRGLILFCSFILTLTACQSNTARQAADTVSTVSSEQAALIRTAGSSGHASLPPVGGSETAKAASAENSADGRQIRITAKESGEIVFQPNNSSVETPAPQKTPGEISPEEDTAMKMNVQIGNSTFTATLEKNAAVDSLIERMKTAPLVIQMSDYAGFEKVGSLGTALPASDSQTTTQSGDIVLYNGSQIVIFYGSNSWRYTRLGKIDDLSGLEEALGNGDVTVTFSAA